MPDRGGVDLTPEDVARRFSNRPGYTLVSYGEVGLPVWKISIRADVLEHKRIGPFSEFILRAVSAQVDQPDEIRELLGLDERVLEATVVGLFGSDDLYLGRDPGSETTTLTLTPKGQKTLESATSIVPEETVIEIHYDGLLRRPIPFLERWLTPYQLREIGAREIPSSPVRPPDVAQLDVAAVDAIVKQLGERRQTKRDLLSLKSIEGRKSVFQHAVVLVFKANDGPETQVAFAIDGRLSDEHEEAFARANLRKKLGIGPEGLESAESLAAEVLGKEVVEEARRATSEGALPNAELPAQAPADGGAPTPDATSGADLNALPPVRALATYDHPAYLQLALAESRDRLLIISPWVRRTIVNAEFVRQLESRLSDGVDVYIGWGMGKLGETDEDMDPVVLKDFERLASQYKWTFRHRRLGGTHSKVLVCDRRFVIAGSFNWMSFKGDPKRTFRDESGFVVSDAAIVDAVFEEWAAKFKSP